MIADRVKETTSTTGTGNLSLLGATAQFQSFNTAFGTNTPFYYVITDANGADWEVGTGQLTNATTLQRTTVHQSSNSDAKINLSSGTHTVFCAAPEVFLSGLAPKSGKLSQFAATTSAELAGVISDETGTGALVFANSPTLVTPNIGTPSAGTVTNLTGTASININGTVGATTPNTGAFTTLSASGVATFSAGTVTAPAITTSGDTNNGIYFPAADNIAITTAGVQRLLVDSSGNLFLRQSSNAANTSVSLNTTVQNALTLDSAGNVGIGTTSPSVKCQVNGAVAVQGTGTPLSGAGMELRYDGTQSVILSYNRTSSTYVPLWMEGSKHDWYVSGSLKMTLDSSGNVGIGTTSFGTSAAGVLAIKNGTAPTTGPADTIQLYSTDLSAGNTMLSLYTEGTVVSNSTDNAVTKKIAIRINGTVYYLLADTDNS